MCVVNKNVCIVNKNVCKNVCIVNKNVCIVLLLLWYFTSAETIRLTRDRQIEVGGRGRLYSYRYTVTTRMTSALRRAVMRAILMFH